MKRRSSRLAIGLLCLSSAIAYADAWLDAGDSELRHDVQYLVDSGVIEVPVTTWPIPSADLAGALADIGTDAPLSPGQRAALHRIQRRITAMQRDPVRTSLHASAAADPLVLRTFEKTPREEGEVGGTFSLANDWLSARVALSAVTSPADGHRFRYDDSYLTARLGNWLLTAGALDRWWGPGWDGTLLLSNNARPVPAVALDRESSRAFKSRWLSWIGPWRATAFMGQLEGERQDLDRPLLFGARITFRPFGNVRIRDMHPLQGLEVGLERTAQWCAKTLPCSGSTFWDLLTGRDNYGESVHTVDEPGNQLAGWTLRWTPPLRIPFTVYRQKTGETIDIGTWQIRRSLELFGVETWGETKAGLTWRAHGEFAGTACGEFAGPGYPQFGCAYSNHLFNVEGYRYRGRPLGHSADGDARVWSAGLLVAPSDQRSATLLVRWADLNRGGFNPLHPLISEPTELWNVELGYKEKVLAGTLQLGLGVDRATDLASNNSVEHSVRGFAMFTREF